MTIHQRTGLLGGTFDPVHRGHVAVAEAVQQAFDLDHVLLVPARVPPHRRAAPVAPPADRFAMVTLAVDARPGLVASDLELADPSPAYTTETLQRMLDAGELATQLFFITGADAFAEIATWRGYPALLDQAHFVVVSRPGHDLQALRRALPDVAKRFRAAALGIDPPAPAGGRTAIFPLEADTPDVASSAIRHRLWAGDDIDDLVPESVARYIREHHLYTPAPPGRQLA